MNIFWKKNLFKLFVNIELSYAFALNLFTTAEHSMEKCIILLKTGLFLLLVIINFPPEILDS